MSRGPDPIESNRFDSIVDRVGRHKSPNFYPANPSVPLVNQTITPFMAPTSTSTGLEPREPVRCSYEHRTSRHVYDCGAPESTVSMALPSRLQCQVGRSVGVCVCVW